MIQSGELGEINAVRSVTLRLAAYSPGKRRPETRRRTDPSERRCGELLW
ncbi:MAG: hypothetical protein R3C28_10825 [Pirellulaceae bacterium]